LFDFDAELAVVVVVDIFARRREKRESRRNDAEYLPTYKIRDERDITQGFGKRIFTARLCKIAPLK